MSLFRLAFILGMRRGQEIIGETQDKFMKNDKIQSVKSHEIPELLLKVFQSLLQFL